MIKKCTLCKKYIGCQKNSDEWERIRELFPVSQEDARMDHHPQTSNEILRVEAIDRVAHRCTEAIFS